MADGDLTSEIICYGNTRVSYGAGLSHFRTFRHNGGHSGIERHAAQRNQRKQNRDATRLSFLPPVPTSLPPTFRPTLPAHSTPRISAAHRMTSCSLGEASDRAASRSTHRHSLCSGRPSSGLTGRLIFSVRVAAR